MSFEMGGSSTDTWQEEKRIPSAVKSRGPPSCTSFIHSHMVFSFPWLLRVAAALQQAGDVFIIGAEGSFCGKQGSKISKIVIQVWGGVKGATIADQETPRRNITVVIILIRWVMFGLISEGGVGFGSTFIYTRTSIHKYYVKRICEFDQSC